VSEYADGVYNLTTYSFFAFLRQEVKDRTSGSLAVERFINTGESEVHCHKRIM
jgi:hypothetical protein